MKSFSPAGMAVKGFYGLGARTFGNPDGALTGGGAWSQGGDNPDGPNQGGGSGGGPPLAWTQRTSPTTDAINAIAVNSAGLAMLVTNAGGASTSSDGGHTWSALTPVSAGGEAVFGLAWGQGVWITATAEAPGSIRRSTNDGASWTLIDTGAADLGVAVATNAAGQWIFAGENGGWAYSNDNGLTWTASTVANAAFIGPFAVFGVPTLPPGPELEYVLLGEAFGSQCIFTVVPSDPIPGFNLFSEPLPGGLAFGNGQLLLGVPAGIRRAPTVLELVLGSDIPIPVLSNNVGVVLCGGGKWFAFDNAGDVANSNDGNTWVAGTIPFFRTEAGAYDAVHNSFIVGSQFGEIATQP